jgi:protein-S-isoprenylcysteine O-methyltransferase Ste14
MGLFALAYGVIVYAAFFAAFLYLIVFVGGDALGAFLALPKTVDAGASPVPAGYGVLVNIALLLAFGLQHTIMARQSFKRVWTRIVPKSAERSTFVLATTAVLIALFYYWTPLPAIVWQVESPLWTAVLMALFASGWALVLLSTFLINHFELFGLAQVWRAFQKQEAPAPRFMTPMLYNGVRHPLYLGFLIAFWSTPTMTAGHLLFAAIWSAYIFVAIGYEERDLVRLFGDRYRQYQARVPMILPFGRAND